MTRFRWLCVVALTTAAIPALTIAQGTGRVTGRVVDQSQRPLPGAQVVIVGTQRGAMTNDEGTYAINNAPVGPQLVRARLIGYGGGETRVTVVAGEVVNADFTLRQTAVALDEVVVSAITGQEERRRESGANIGNIRVEDLTKGPITKLSDVITGRTAGVTTQGTAGTTGTSQRIRVRGANSLSLSNEPLIYIDGVQASNSITLGAGAGGQGVSRLNDINPEDIENIEVLKGPAASALYGTAAANGVFLITTKRGRAGATRWNTYVELGTVNDENDYPTIYYPYRLATPGAPLTTATGAFNSAARPACFNYQAAIVGAGSCVRDSVAAQNVLEDSRTTPFTRGFRDKFGANAAGGNDVVTYYVSGDHEYERGVINYNTLNKTNLRANLTAQLRSDLRLQVSSGYVTSGVAVNSNDNSVFSPLINGFIGRAFFFPNTASGRRNRMNYWQFEPEILQEYVSHQDVDRFTVGTTGTYTPLTWLSANANVGLDYINRHDYRTLQPNRLPIAQSFTIGNRQSDRSNTYLITGNASASGRFTIMPELVSTTTLGGSYNRSLFQQSEGFGAGIVEGTRNLGATSSLFVVDEDFSEVITVGGFVRQEFAWKDRLFLAGSIRGDDNSAFGRDFGLIYYPAVNASWVIADEPWFPQTNVVSSLRLRAAYGKSGLRPDFRDAETFFNPAAVQVGGGSVAAVTLQNTGNEDLEPEKTTEYEFGFDVGLFDERVSLEATYFDKKSRDALINRQLPASIGLTATIIDNLGSIRNWGTELGLNALALDMEQVKLNLRASATFLRNEVVALGVDLRGNPIADIVINRGAQRHRRGYSAGSFWSRPITYNDANGDGLLSASEVTLGDTAVYIGPSLPRYTHAIGADLTVFRYVTVSTLFEGRGGHKTLNDSEAFRCNNSQFVSASGCDAAGNPNASLEEQAAFIANFFGGAAPSRAGTSIRGFIEDASFVKWRELAITLQAPQQLPAYLRAFRGASLTLAGRNLATWTDYPGIDPEIVEAATLAFNQSEFNTQPPVRYYTARLNFSF
jgi:TonB-linked SusC/RagA family outer membrane protein